MSWFYRKSVEKGPHFSPPHTHIHPFSTEAEVKLPSEALVKLSITHFICVRLD